MNEALTLLQSRVLHRFNIILIMALWYNIILIFKIEHKTAAYQAYMRLFSYDLAW